MLAEFTQKFEIIHNNLSALSKTISLLSKLNVPLDSDPILKGLNSFNQKISDIQKAKDYLCEIALQALTLKNKAEFLATQFSEYLTSKKGDIFESNREFYNSEFKTQVARDVALGRSLVPEVSLNIKIKQLVIISKGYHETTKTYLLNMESCNNNLKKQLSIIELQISIGELDIKNPFIKGE